MCYSEYLGAEEKARDTKGEGRYPGKSPDSNENGHSPVFQTGPTHHRGAVEAQTCKKELVIEVPADVLRREVDDVTARYARVARLPGFRPGHAPASLVRRRFKDEIKSDVVQALVPKFFDNAVKEQKLSVVGEPEFEDLKFEEDQPLTVKAAFEIYPEFELKEYKGLQVEEAPATTTDAELDQALEEVRERVAVTEVVTDRPAEDGDYVTVTYQGRDAKEPEKTLFDAQERVFQLAGQGTPPAFTENLRGARPGDVRTFEVAYPLDHPGKRLAGKTVSYRAELQSIKTKVLPPVDDELAKSASEFSTLSELRAKLGEDLEKGRQQRTEGTAKRQLLDTLIQAHEFPVPERLVEEQLRRLLETVVGQLRKQGVDLRQAEIDWPKLRERFRPEAERDVRGALILEKIADAEKIETSEAEVDEMIREMAEGIPETPAALKTRLTESGGLAKIKSSRRTQKALDFVYHSAQIIRKSE